jgi:hypothetical protein
VLDREEGEEREREREVEGEREIEGGEKEENKECKSDSSIPLPLIVFSLFVRRDFLIFSNLGFSWI